MCPASVLLVDDLRANLVALEAVLEPLGLRLVRAQSGAEAIARASEADFALVLMDVQMPVLDGFETTRLLHERLGRNVPVIFVSAVHHDRASIDAGYAAGGVDYLAKPLDPELLKAKVQAFVDLYRRDQVIAAQQAQLRARELSAARELERANAAEEANRTKDEFLAVVSHELRTPLNAIVGWAELLHSRRVDGDRADKAVDAILRNARAQAEVIDDLVDVSHLLAGSLTLRAESVDLVTIVRDVADALVDAADEAGVELRLQLAGTAQVYGDRARLRQVATKLIANAIKFSRARATVDVWLEHLGSEVELRVEDQGIGIPPAFLPYVFQRFRQADTGNARVHGGLGLSLSLTRHLVEMHGGAITVDSAGEDRGATFTVRLPAGRAHTPPPFEIRPNPGSGVHRIHPQTAGALAGLSVLVVDDEPDTLDLVAEILEFENALVRKARSAETALVILQGETIDILVTDLSMPKEDGFSLLRTLAALDRARGRRTPAIALSARSTPGIRDQVLSAGFSAYLAKPCYPNDLVGTIAAVAKRV